jgi:integrase
VSDFMRFTKEMIRYEKNKSDGILKPLLEFTQKKTTKIMTVPLHKKVMEILDKRNGDFPYSTSDQKYNENIKEVCREAGLNEIVNGSKSVETETGSKIYRKQSGTFEKWELVTSHIGRRSFASNHYGIIPTNYLIYITGHSTETMFLNYIGKSNKDKAMEMTNFF